MLIFMQLLIQCIQNNYVTKIMKKFFALSAICMSIISINANAQYSIKIPLEPNSIALEDADVLGTMKLTPSTINRGGSSTIVWDYGYADQIDIDGIGSYTSKTGNVSVSPLKTTAYKATITHGSKSKVEDLLLNVIQPEQDISFSADSYRIGLGTSTNLNWDVKNAESIILDNGIGSQSLKGSYIISPTHDTRYMLTAKGFETTADKNADVNIVVVPNAIINSFTVDKINITTGQTVNFNWNVSNAEQLTFNGENVDKPTGIKSETYNTVGNYTSKLEATSLSGVKSNNTQKVNVFAPAEITTFTVNGLETIDVSPNDSLVFNWDVKNMVSVKLNNEDTTGNTKTLIADQNIGTFNYQLDAFNGANDKVSKSVKVNVIGDVVMNQVNAPSNVFANAPFTLSWAGTGATKYTLKSNNSSSGVSTSENDQGSAVTKDISPTTAGTYTYTVAGYNTANKKTESSKTVIVENNPTFDSFTVNGNTNITVAPSSPLSYAGTGISAGAFYQGRNSSNDTSLTNPATAPTGAGSYTYYMVAAKTLNGINRYSALRSVQVNVVNAPTISAISAPTNVFANTGLSLSWSGTNVSSYTIKSNSGSSGVPTTETSLGTATSYNPTPTAAGTYVYTVTATNLAGVSVSNSQTVVVEPDPTFSAFAVNGTTSVNVPVSSALSFTSSGLSGGSTFVARNSVNTANDTLPGSASATAGTISYYGAVVKTLNSVTRYSALKSVTVTTIANPIVGAISVPASGKAGVAFTISWSGSNISSYAIRSNAATSGISTTSTNIGGATSISPTPTAPGTYSFVVTGYNSLGVAVETGSSSIAVASASTCVSGAGNSTTRWMYFPANSPQNPTPTAFQQVYWENVQVYSGVFKNPFTAGGYTYSIDTSTTTICRS